MVPLFFRHHWFVGFDSTEQTRIFLQEHQPEAKKTETVEPSQTEKMMNEQALRCEREGQTPKRNRAKRAHPRTGKASHSLIDPPIFWCKGTAFLQIAVIFLKIGEHGGRCPTRVNPAPLVIARREYLLLYKFYPLLAAMERI